MKDTREFDLSDVRTVLALEAPARALLEALAAAGPAFDRLEAAKFAGADRVGYLWGEVHEWLKPLSESLEDMRIANGDEITWGFRDLARWPVA